MEQNMLRISVKELKPNMILAKDISTKKGVVILAKNTMLNKVNYTKLTENDIKHVYIFKDSIEDDALCFTDKAHTVEAQMEPITEKAEFKSFERRYNDSLEKTKEVLSIIGDGKQLANEYLYSVTNEVINLINCKSDLLTYFGYLRESNDHTYKHSINVSLMCNLFAKWIGVNDEELKWITIAGLLHDVGKIKIDSEILNKKGKLTDEEFETVQKHTIYGYDLVKNMNIPDEVKKAVLMHHEKVNGTGYPNKLKGNDIGRYAKIVAICDVYEAMTSSRVYRDKYCPFKVIEEFERQSFGLLDMEYLFIFLQNIAYTYVGSWVALNDNSIAEVMFINKSNMGRPIVKKDGEFIDLSMDTDKYIVNIV